jgi:pimeloyl-ACP methyl ester carboxylesterase
MHCVPRKLRAIVSVMCLALSVAFIPSSGSFAQSQEKSAPQSKFAEINGVKLHYLVAGKGDPVVLLHGFAETSHMWRPLIAKLSDKHTVIAPDLRGFGQSSAPEGGYTKKAMAQDIHALVKSLKYDRIRLVGHDIGLMVAYAYAAQYPSEVERVVLMEAFLPGVGEWNPAARSLALPFLRQDAAGAGHRPRAHLSRTFLERFRRRCHEIRLRGRS